ncbi:von Willebrand factor A domain-containing protein 3A [Callorhinchus milii]|nr:von Willebrand factor A domain-containing protein 3A [Callorhinchus milii]
MNKGIKHLQFSAHQIDTFESRVCELIEVYQHRLTWLAEGSRKMFGLVTGSRVGVLVDASDANCGVGRRQDFQKALLCLLDEQLSYRKQLYLVSFGTSVSPLWENVRDVNIRTLGEARQWVQELEPSGGCNLLRAMKHLLQVKELNSLLIVLGSCPDQTSEIWVDYFEQCALGKPLPLHTIAYDCSSYLTQAALQRLAQATGGRYHCYSSDCENEVDLSSDRHLLLREIQRAGEILNMITNLRQGIIGDTPVSILPEISAEVAIPPSQLLTWPLNHNLPLHLEASNFLPKPSAEWLRQTGLKAKKLSLYQVLAPNAFSPQEAFIPILRKTVSSTLHQRAMMQFEWHDGSVKNVHVDPALLYRYQKQLGQAVRTFEHRVDWLSTDSRKIWGTLCEKRVVLLVDISVSNSMHIAHIQHAVRLILEQQMTNKHRFNLIAFGSDVEQYQPQLVSPTPDHLQDAWRWVLGLQYGGSRNLMAAFKRAIECEVPEVQEPCGVYLFTSGLPDQEKDVLGAYVAEVTSGHDLPLHVCLFQIGDFGLDSPVPVRYASPSETASELRSLARWGRGRFHWCQDTEIVESDDINAILAEIEKAANYSCKCTMLVESLKGRSRRHADGLLQWGDEEKTLVRERQRPLKLPGPKPTALTLARMQARDESGEDTKPALKALTWRPNSSKAVIPAARPHKNWLHVSEAKPKKVPKVSKSVFYADVGNKIGIVFQNYPKMKSVRKKIPFVSLPKEEDVCSTKEWLQKYGVRKLKLDLHKLLSGPDCVHQKKRVPNLHKHVSAKYCTVFPSVEVNGLVRHLQLQPHELEMYIEQVERVLRRYVQRMQWLLSGSRRFFGTILEKKICLLLDTSGSMDPFLEELKKELTSLIWEQLRKYSVSFNLLCFSGSVEAWQDGLVEATDETCQDAVQWVAKVIAQGTTCTLQALKEMQQMKRKVTRIHTISFNCLDSAANDFLKKLAAHMGGRYHRCHGATDGHLVAHKMLTEGFSDEDNLSLPVFEGDDLKILSGEINKARRFLTQARSFRALLLEKQMKPHQMGTGVWGKVQADTPDVPVVNPWHHSQ